MISEPFADAPAPLAALSRVADVPSLALLAAGGHGATLLAWDAPVEPVAGWDALARLEASLPQCERHDDAAPGWLAPLSGDAVVQLDYEFPTARGRAWRLDRFIAWDRGGAATLVGRDASDLRALRADLARAPRPLAPARLVRPLTPAWDGDGHARRVERIRALIAAGDIYQANLTLAFAAPLADDRGADAALAATLLAASPAPYAAFLRGGGVSIVSHSPERFLRLIAGDLETAPIKGTRRRVVGRDEATCDELLASAKDRAELAMIVDLARNDLGRVALPGSVRVAAAAEVLGLSYVHHLLARVRGRARDGIGACDAIRAAFPAGSITGCPKIRAMQVIAEVEPAPRGAYCGAFGWLGRGACDLAVAIRTVVVDGASARLHAGGGIVADSDPRAEWDEARAKAAAMAAALGGSV